MNANHTSNRTAHPDQEFAKATSNQRRGQTIKPQCPRQNIPTIDERMTRYTKHRRERTIQIQYQPVHGACSNMHAQASRLQWDPKCHGVCSGFRIRKLLKDTTAPLNGPHAEPFSGTANPLPGDCQTCRIRNAMKLQTVACKDPRMESGCCAKPWCLNCFANSPGLHPGHFNGPVWNYTCGPCLST